jgi:hypothetical protein
MRGKGFRPLAVAPALLGVSPVQNGDIPMTVTFLLLTDDRSDSSHDSASPALTAAMGSPAWQALLAEVPTSGVREGAVRLGAQLAPKGASRDGRFVPLAAVVPTAHVTH